MNARFDPEEARDAAIAELARKHATAVAANIRAGHVQTLNDLGNDVGDKLANNDVMATLLSAAAAGPLTVGNLFRDLVQRCIDNDAELEAIKEVERMEADAKADPDNYLPKRAQVRAMDRALDMLRA